MIVKKENKLQFNNGVNSFAREFEFNVHEVFNDENKIYVVLDTGGVKAPSEKKSRNIFCLSEEGEILWQIQSPKNTTDQALYVSIKKINGRLIAMNWNSFVYQIDPMTGQVLECIGSAK